MEMEAAAMGSSLHRANGKASRRDWHPLRRPRRISSSQRRTRKAAGLGKVAGVAGMAAAEVATEVAMAAAARGEEAMAAAAREE
eukprot:scaffold101296_cov33-Phaeocystis_antarctica.AAC.1